MISCYKKPEGIEQNRFKVSIDLVSYRNKTIYVFYKTNTDNRYEGKLSLKKNVKASAVLQNVVFEFPHGIKPKNIRIDFEENENDSIRVENIRFQYKNRVIDGDKGIYRNWFTFKEEMVQGKDGLTFHLKRRNNIFGPQMDGNQVLNSKLVKLFPPDINEF